MTETCRADGGLLGSHDPTGSGTWLAFASRQNAEHVVVACGGVVGEDQCPQVGGRDSARREVEAAALAQAGAAAVPAAPPSARLSATRLRWSVRLGVPTGMGPPLKTPPPWPLPPLPPVARAADGPVQGDQRVGHGEDAAVHVRDAAALAGPARGAGTADGLVAENACCGRRWRSRSRSREG